jgi:O-methyltransferase
VISAVRALTRVLNSAAALRVLDVLDRRSENRTTEFGMLAQAFEFVKINGVLGDYFEFGVWRGKTFGYARIMARRYRLPHIRFRAFDSFAGLPATTEETYNIWAPGQFACSRHDFEAILQDKGFAPGEYVVTEGFYSDSLNETLIESMRRERVQAAIVYIDCDLYESTRDVLNFIRHFLQDGSIICFDDYYNYRGRADRGEQRALTEFLAVHPDVLCRPYMPYSPLGMSFICELRAG